MEIWHLIFLMLFFLQSFAFRIPVICFEFTEASGLPGLHIGRMLQDDIFRIGQAAKNFNILNPESIDNAAAQAGVYFSAQSVLNDLNAQNNNNLSYCAKKIGLSYSLCGIMRYIEINAQGRCEAQIELYLIDLRRGKIIDFLNLRDADSSSELLCPAHLLYSLDRADFDKTSCGRVVLRLGRDISKWLERIMEMREMEIVIDSIKEGEIMLSAGCEMNLREHDIYRIYRFTPGRSDEEIGLLEISEAIRYGAVASVRKGIPQPGDYIKIKPSPGRQSDDQK